MQHSVHILNFRVRAKAGLPESQERTSDATITINLLDVNDNYPEFDKVRILWKENSLEFFIFFLTRKTDTKLLSNFEKLNS